MFNLLLPRYGIIKAAMNPSELSTLIPTHGGGVVTVIKKNEGARGGMRCVRELARRRFESERTEWRGGL